MKKKLFFVLSLVFVFGFYFSNAQVQEKGIPWGLTYDLETKNLKLNELKAPDVQKLLAEDLERAKEGQFYRVGVALPVHFTLENSGEWTILQDKRKIWRLRVVSKGAEALVLDIDRFKMPLGAKFYVYSADKSHIIGAFTNKNNKEDLTFATRMVLSDDIILELNLPAKLVEEPEISIFNVGYIYRNAESFLWKSSKPSGSCEVNINCSPEGDNWQDEKRGVARILLKAGSSYGYCTGSLINNTRNDCTPYFLSAAHCAESSSSSDFPYWRFYFNYEASTCSGSTGPDNQTVVGCEEIVYAANDIGNTSDLLLLRLTSSVPESYNPFFNGWDRGSSIPSTAVGIHHPSGDIKKISHGYNLSNYYSTHIKIYWEATQNGHGVTEGGSSGSPLFDENTGLIIGTLTGGYSACDNLSGYDMYGRMWYHWDENGSTQDVQLKPWLDPDNTGVTTLQGTYCGNVAPTANFSASPTTVAVGGTVNFQDLSTGNPTSWSWDFGDGTTSTQQNPSHVYNALGYYTVSLTVSNSNGSDTETKNAYIHVVEQTMECDTLNYPLSGTATLYTSINGGYVLGNNGYGDLAKAQYFTLPSGYDNLTALFFWFGVVKDGGNGTQVTFKVWDENNGTLGNVLGTATVSLSDIKDNFDNNYMTAILFDPPINLTGDFFAGVILPTGSGDTLALVSNTDGDATPPNVAWEQFSDGSWYAVNDQSSWGINIAAGIFAVVCPEVNDIEIFDNNKALSVYPNPSNGRLEIKYISEYRGDLTFKIVSVDGKVVYEENIRKSTTIMEKKLDIDIPDGVYSLMISTDADVITHKIIIKK